MTATTTNNRPLLVLRMPIPDRPWSTNDDRRLNHHDRHRRIQTWKAATFYAYRQQVGVIGARALLPGVVQVAIPFKDNRVRDPHNYCGTVLKAVIDGLVEAGAWPDDTPRYVGHREPLIYKGGEVVVTVYEKEREEQ